MSDKKNDSSGDKASEATSVDKKNDKFPKDAIRLDAAGGMDFKQIEGKCKKCRLSKWPLLSDIGWCKFCILIRLRGDIPPIVAPEGAQQNEGHIDRN